MKPDETSEPTSIYSPEEIREQIAERAAEIAERFDDSVPLLVSALTNSVFFLTDLVRSLARPVRYEFIRVDYVQQEQTEILNIEYPMPFELRDEELLLLRDVSTSGVIESYLTQQFRQMGARRVRVVTLLDRPYLRTTDFEPDYTCFTPDETVGTLVGYGLKQAGRFGHLPYIGAVP